LGVYAMTKAALENMVKWMHVELREEGIRVNGVAPGLIKTEFSGTLWKDNKNVNPKSLGESE
jgi:NAD(P)-dependent dehydrogenase (short-subunit alcohol dehydrogenase family)